MVNGDLPDFCCSFKFSNRKYISFALSILVKQNDNNKSVSQMIPHFSFLFYHAGAKNFILSITGFSLSKNICGAF